MNKFVKNIPNMITFSRLIASILAPILLIFDQVTAAIYVYAYGAFSDLIDGVLARRLNAFSELGRKLDAVSDKLFALSVTLPSIIYGNYFMILILTLEGIIAGIMSLSYMKFKKGFTERVGKFKTFSLFITVVLGLIMIYVRDVSIVFFPCYLLTLILQYKAIKTYINQYISNRKEYENNIKVDIIKKLQEEYERTNDKKIREKIISLKDEMVHYVMDEVPLQKSKKKQG